MPDKYIFAFRLVLGITFVYASIDKVLHPDQFAKIIYYYKLMPGDLINVFALLLPWIELIAGIFLIFGYWEKSAALLITLLLVVFLVALTSAFARGIDISCGCFSTTSRVKGHVLSYIFRDALMIVAVLMILAARERFLSFRSKSPQTV